MSGKRYTEEFKIAAEAGGGAWSPGERSSGAPGVSIHSLYTWTKRYGVPQEERKAVDSQADEMRRLKAELKPVTEERDILKEPAVYFAKTSGLVTPVSRVPLRRLPDLIGVRSGFLRLKSREDNLPS